MNSVQIYPLLFHRVNKEVLCDQVQGLSLLFEKTRGNYIYWTIDVNSVMQIVHVAWQWVRGQLKSQNQDKPHNYFSPWNAGNYM